MNYQIQFMLINGLWYDHKSYDSFHDAKCETLFHINVSEEAKYGYRIVDIQKQEIVVENNF